MTESAIVSNSNGYSNKPRETRAKRRSMRNRFLVNAKGFAKKGIYGRGTHIDEGAYSYFLSIAENVHNEDESTIEDKVVMANNVLEQTRGQEIHLISNQLVSRVIENLIAFADPEHFERFLNAFSENFRPICSDSFASHVIQKVIDVCFLRAAYYKKQATNDETKPVKKKKRENLTFVETHNTTQKFKKSHREKCSEFIQKIGKFLLNNLEDFLWDSHANHIIRTSIFALVGIREAKVAFVRNDKIQKYEAEVEVPSEWVGIVKEYVERLQMWPQFPDFPYDTLSSLTLSYLIIALRTFDKSALKHLGKKILMESFLKADDDGDEEKKIITIDDDNEELRKADDAEASKDKLVVPKVFRYTSSVRLLETMLETAGKKLFTQLYAMLFIGRFRKLALNRQTNFAVQKVIENIKQSSDFESIFEELHESIETLLKVGHSGVVESLARACLRLSTKQAAFVSALLSALHISGSKEKFDSLIICILKLKPYEVAIEDKSQFIHLHGALILQHMLQFNKPIKLVQSILDVPANDLASIFSTSHGSFVADTFVDSKSIGEKSREKLLKHLEGEYLSMGSTKFGSRVVENLFWIANEGQKSKIAKELSERSNQLNATVYGRLLYDLLHIKTWKLSVSQWKAALSKTQKAEMLFKDIVK